MLNAEILLTIKLHQQLFVDPKRIKLLKEIDRCGSINQAAKNAQVSYKSAWDHLQAMNEISPKPLLERNAGGKHGGGTSLTQYAHRLLQLYDLLEQTQEKAFTILHDENVPLTSLLSATARFALQSSARNQLFGKVSSLNNRDGRCLVGIEITGVKQPLFVLITNKSAVRLQLFLGKEVMVMIKAPWIHVYPQFPANNDSVNYFEGKISNQSSETDKEILIKLNQDIELCATQTVLQDVTINDTVWVHIDPEQIVLLTL